jgi:hypothetical protein
MREIPIKRHQLDFIHMYISAFNRLHSIRTSLSMASQWQPLPVKASSHCAALTPNKLDDAWAMDGRCPSFLIVANNHTIKAKRKTQQ